MQHVTTWQQQGLIGSDQTRGIQETFVFNAPEAAEAAYQNLLAAMSRCQDNSRSLQAKSHTAPDAVVNTTATTADGTAWSRRWNAVEGMSSEGVQTNHLYALRHGSDLILMHIDELSWESSAKPYDTRNDAAVLAELAGRAARS
ncbi:hypothetical protein [Kitasatospora sp. NPDC001175]|uniref:hypothetical protein n=1 Tax=Kitasatospora sp. NPDC001175 TaxID=3157103 RepID=UPI003D08D039